MKLVKLPASKQPRAYVRKDAHQEQWVQDLHRHVKQYKRCCTTVNNRDLKRIEVEVGDVLARACDWWEHRQEQQIEDAYQEMCEHGLNPHY